MGKSNFVPQGWKLETFTIKVACGWAMVFHISFFFSVKIGCLDFGCHLTKKRTTTVNTRVFSANRLRLVQSLKVINVAELTKQHSLLNASVVVLKTALKQHCLLSSFIGLNIFMLVE